jgi:hypothetical protein
VVTDQTKATHVLKSAPVEVKSESTGGKIARCLLASCRDRGQGECFSSIDCDQFDQDALAYSVNKQRGGSKNEQSMAEAVAKHFKEFLEKEVIMLDLSAATAMNQRVESLRALHLIACQFPYRRVRLRFLPLLARQSH